MPPKLKSKLLAMLLERQEGKEAAAAAASGR